MLHQWKESNANKRERDATERRVSKSESNVQRKHKDYAPGRKRRSRTIEDHTNVSLH